jgi:amino acid transporter
MDPMAAGTGSDASPPVGTLGQGKLGVPSISALVISAVAPISVLAAAVPVIFAIQGAGTPAIFVIAGVLYAIFAVGYVAMSRHMVNAGGFVAYIDRAFGKKAATAMAYVTVLFYFAAIISFYAISGAVAADILGIFDQYKIITFAFLILVAIVGLTGVQLNARVLLILLAVEAVTIIVLDVALAIQGGPDGFTFAGFDPGIVFGAGFGIALLLAMVCFSGLEATVVFSEEAKNPRRTIPRAVYLSLAVVIVVYAVSAWLMTVQVGIQAASIAPEQIGSFFFDVAYAALGEGFATYLSYLVILSFLALFIGFQNLITRYVFALGRAGALPQGLGKTNGRGTPVVASLVVSITIAIILGIFTFGGADPFTVTYAWLVGLGTVGLLISLCAVSVSVIVFFGRTKLETNVWTTKIAPLVSGVGLLAVLVLALTNYEILGSTPESARLLLILIPIAAILGWIVAEYRIRSGKSLDYSAELSG